MKAILLIVLILLPMAGAWASYHEAVKKNAFFWGGLFWLNIAGVFCGIANLINNT